MLEMRFLALLTDGFGAGSGIAQYNRDFLSAIAASASTKLIVAIPRFGRVEVADLPERLSQLGPAPSRTAYAARAFSAALTRGPFEIVFCGHLYMAPLAAAVARFLRIPLWLQLHGIEAWQPP